MPLRGAPIETQRKINWGFHGVQQTGGLLVARQDAVPVSRGSPVKLQDGVLWGTTKLSTLLGERVCIIE